MSQAAQLPEVPAVPEVPAPTEEEEREFAHALAWLVIVPFTFPLWLRMRRDRPGLALRLAWAGYFNVAQSLFCVALVVLAVWALVMIPPLVARYVSLVLR